MWNAHVRLLALGRSRTILHLSRVPWYPSLFGYVREPNRNLGETARGTQNKRPNYCEGARLAAQREQRIVESLVTAARKESRQLFSNAKEKRRGDVEGLKGKGKICK